MLLPTEVVALLGELKLLPRGCPEYVESGKSGSAVDNAENEYIFTCDN